MSVQLFIDGQWRDGSAGRWLPVVNPATEEVIDQVACASPSDLDNAVQASVRGFEAWKARSAVARAALLRDAASRLRARVDELAPMLTREQGKPLAEARIEILGCCELIEYNADEARHVYGRVTPARGPGTSHLILKEPVGPVAAFSPWNFPVSQALRKVAAALAAGCSIILKGPEEAPGACAEMVRALADAGVDQGAIGLVFGVPSEISAHLIAHPGIRKVSFTGSTAVGKQLASLAGAHMKRVTMELGGHAPAIVFADADVPRAAALLAGAKFRNAGQICGSPTRFLVQAEAHDEFVDRFVAEARKIRVGDGAEPDVTMGPLAHDRRVTAMQAFVQDAVQAGAKVALGGHRIGNKGYFFEPTVLTDVPTNARAMNEEPFGPLALVRRFETADDALQEARRIPYGLAATAFTASRATGDRVYNALENGWVGINTVPLPLPELPFGGVKDSGYGSEGGPEGLEPYLSTKCVTLA